MAKLRTGRASRVRVASSLLAAVALGVIAFAGPVSFEGVANAAPFTLGPCNGDLTGSVFTLTANCSTTVQINIPSTITTFNGAGFTISASDPAGGQFQNAVLTNAGPGQTMTIENVTITGPSVGFNAAQCGPVLNGIWFNDASGMVSNATVENMWQQQTNPNSPACVVGNGIRIDGNSGPRTLTVSGGTVVNTYQRNGIIAVGSVTMNVSGVTIGPPKNLQGFIAQNGLQYYLGAGGTASNNTIYGSGDQVGTGPDVPTDGTAVLLYSATDVTLSNNVITSDASTAGTDLGIGVYADSTGITISNNQIGRHGPDVPDPTGVGIWVDALTSTATLICNSFTNWNTNIVGALQISCVPLPNGTECVAYSANVFSVQGGVAPYTWTVASGLPPGLTMASSNGAISGTPTQAGTFNFNVQVAANSGPLATTTVLQDQTGLLATDVGTAGVPLSATQAQTITIAPDCTTTTVPPPPTPTIPPTTTTTAPPTTTTIPPTTTTTTLPPKKPPQPSAAAKPAPVAPITDTTVPVTG